MPRPPKEGLEYFPHDSDAANDKKMQAVISLCGISGYGFYWYLVERIYREGDLSLDISDAETIQILCRNMNIETQEFDRYLTVTLKYGLFIKDTYDSEKKLCSNGVQKRAKAVLDKRKKAKQEYDLSHPD